jgi:hypothetical protein
VGLTDAIQQAITGRKPDDTETPIGVNGREVLFTLEPEGVAQIRQKSRDKDTDERKILPGMSGIVAKYAITAEPVTEEAQLIESELLTRTSYLWKFTVGQRGKWFTVSVAWQTETGEKGTFSALQATVIP